MECLEFLSEVALLPSYRIDNNGKRRESCCWPSCLNPNLKEHTAFTDWLQSCRMGDLGPVTQ